MTLTKRCKERLEGVNEDLVLLVKEVAKVSTIDFRITEGLRTLERQKKLKAQGRSRTLKSKHLDGDAVDIAVFEDSTPVWDIPSYEEVASIFFSVYFNLVKSSKFKHKHKEFVWGGAWNLNVVSLKKLITGKKAHSDYINLRRSQGKRPFIDCPHFQLVLKK